MVSLQKQAPQHSPFFLATLSVSQTSTLKNTVIANRYKNMIHTLEKAQKELRAGRLLAAPNAKASAFVKDVIVMAGPEWAIASWILA